MGIIPHFHNHNPSTEYYVCVPLRVGPFRIRRVLLSVRFEIGGYMRGKSYSQSYSVDLYSLRPSTSRASDGARCRKISKKYAEFPESPQEVTLGQNDAKVSAPN